MTDWRKRRETALQRKNALEDYRDIVDRKAYYVDKTWFIRDFLREGNQVVMYTRPRRFGKTLMLSTLRAFLEREFDCDGNPIDKRSLFEGRRIMDAEPEILDQMGKYPVISLSLKDCAQTSFDLFCMQFRRIMANVALEHDYLLHSEFLAEEEIRVFKKMRSGQMDAEEAAEALFMLTDWIYYDTGIKPFILVDEYDTPLQWAHENHYYDLVLPIMQSLLDAATDTHGNITKALLTGYIPLSQMNTKMDFPNLYEHSWGRLEINEYFGFSRDEVHDLMHYFHLDAQISEVRSLLEGYNFGNRILYIPGDVIDYVKLTSCAQDVGKSYFLEEPRDARLIREIVQEPQLRNKLETLLRGASIDVVLDDTTFYFAPFPSFDSGWIWPYFLCLGFVKIRHSFIGKDGKHHVIMQLLNHKVRILFSSYVDECLHEKIYAYDLEEFYQRMWHCEDERLTEYLNKILLVTVNYYEDKRAFYHGLILEILSCLEGVEVMSNGDVGNGCPDIILRDYDNSRAIVFVFRYAKSLAMMKPDVAAAISQMYELGYGEDLQAEGFTVVVGVAIAFYAKRCVMRARNLTGNGDDELPIVVTSIPNFR